MTLLRCPRCSGPMFREPPASALLRGDTLVCLHCGHELDEGPPMCREGHRLTRAGADCSACWLLAHPVPASWRRRGRKPRKEMGA